MDEKAVLDLLTRYNDEPEGTQLDFKSSHLLDERQKPGAVLGEIVSAFANATGGTIIVGVSETFREAKKTYVLDDGIVADLPTRERLGKLIAANVTPPIVPEIEPIKKANGKYLFAISIPQGEPGKVYQAVPQRVFYRRHGDQSLPMAEYEIRERYQYAVGPDIRVVAALSGATLLPPKPWGRNPEMSIPIALSLRAINRNPPAVKHALFDFYFDERLNIWNEEQGGWPSDHKGSVLLESGPKPATAIDVAWNVPPKSPIFQNVPASLIYPLSVHIPRDIATGVFNIYWAAQAENMAPTSGGFLLTLKADQSLSLVPIVGFKLPMTDAPE